MIFCFFFSILKKTCFFFRERMTFFGKGSWLYLSLEFVGELVLVFVVGADIIDLLDIGEKIFIFRNFKESEILLYFVFRKKKKNFLNVKKVFWVLGLD